MVKKTTAKKKPNKHSRKTSVKRNVKKGGSNVGKEVQVTDVDIRNVRELLGKIDIIGKKNTNIGTDIIDDIVLINDVTQYENDENILDNFIYIYKKNNKVYISYKYENSVERQQVTDLDSGDRYIRTINTMLSTRGRIWGKQKIYFVKDGDLIAASLKMVNRMNLKVPLPSGYTQPPPAPPTTKAPSTTTNTKTPSPPPLPPPPLAPPPPPKTLPSPPAKQKLLDVVIKHSGKNIDSFDDATATFLKSLMTSEGIQHRYNVNIDNIKQIEDELETLFAKICTLPDEIKKSMINQIKSTAV